MLTHQSATNHDVCAVFGNRCHTVFRFVSLSVKILTSKPLKFIDLATITRQIKRKYRERLEEFFRPVHPFPLIIVEANFVVIVVEHGTFAVAFFRAVGFKLSAYLLEESRGEVNISSPRINKRRSPPPTPPHLLPIHHHPNHIYLKIPIIRLNIHPSHLLFQETGTIIPSQLQIAPVHAKTHA